MGKEQDVTLSGLKTAIRMEIDGKDFYLKSSQASKSDLGKKLLKQLAAEEDIHRKVFEGIYKNISANKGWPEIKVKPDGVLKLKTMFSEAVKALGKNTPALSTELTAVETAMDMENKTYDFYKERSGAAVYSGEKQLYEEISAQEKEHHRILLDYYEFLKNPEFYYVNKEHLSVDGG